MRPPVVAVGDGALGFWAAVRDVWPKTREQRDWVHELGNILDKLPRGLQPRVEVADALLTFLDFPAERWKHLRTSNVIESPFATVLRRQHVTKGACALTKGPLMAYKLLDMARGSLATGRRGASAPARARGDHVRRRGYRTRPTKGDRYVRTARSALALTL